MNTIKFQTIANYIKANAQKGIFPVDTAEKLRRGEIELRDNTEFIRAEVPTQNSGEHALLTPNGLELPGVSSIKGESLRKLQNQVITHVRVAYASDAAAGKEAAVSYANDKGSVPAALATANLILEQAGKTIIKMPVVDLISPANDGNSSYTELSAFALLKEDVSFQVKLEFANGSDFGGTDKHYVEVALKGMGTFQK